MEGKVGKSIYCTGFLLQLVAAWAQILITVSLSKISHAIYLNDQE